jgi:hypothetical protein
MDQIQTGNEEIGRANKDQTGIFQKTTGIPDKHGDAARHNDAEQFNKTVKKKIVNTAGYKQSHQKKEAKDDRLFVPFEGHQKLPLIGLPRTDRSLLGPDKQDGTKAKQGPWEFFLE